GPNGPGLAIGAQARCLRPNLVNRAARNGLARSACVRLKRGDATWNLSAVAEASRPLSRETRSETEVLMILLHESAPVELHPLWSTSARRARMDARNSG